MEADIMLIKNFIKIIKIKNYPNICNHFIDILSNFLKKNID